MTIEPPERKQGHSTLEIQIMVWNDFKVWAVTNDTFGI